MEISVKKEKLIVLVGVILTTIAGYVAGKGLIYEAGLIETLGGAVLVFWSEGVNTAKT